MFLGDLIERALGETTGIAPRRASRFEPDAEAPQPAVTESAEAAPARGREVIPPPLTPEASSEFPSRLEPIIVERRMPPAESVPSPNWPKVTVAEKAGEPSPAAAPPPSSEPSGERAAPRSEPPAAAAPPSRLAPLPVPTAELRTETVVREKTEVRVESRTIERRLESLVRQIERAEEMRTTVLVPSEDRPAIPPAAPQPPLPRSVVVPAVTTKSAPLKPVLLEPSGPAPAAPVVHVTIGRVEVRAAAPAPAQRKPRPSEPRLDLEAYLRRREGA
jgi:hypothetical protein